MANTLKFGNGNWATKEGSTLAYNDENNNFKPLPFSFERGSSATVVNKDGLIETVGSGQPRVDYKDDSKGAMLLEPSRTNFVAYSNGFDNVAWDKGGGGTATAPIISSNQGTSPDGTNNAFKVELNLNGGTTSSDRCRLTDNFTGSTSTDYIFSFYAKAYSSSDVGKKVKFSVDNSTGDALFTLTSEWKRFVFVGTSTGTNINQHIQLRGNESTSDSVTMLLYGYQAEQGSYATSYIPTSGSAVTRLADACNNGANEQVINSTEGVLYAEISALSNDGTNRRISISNGSSSDRVLLGYTSSSNQLIALVSSNSVSGAVGTVNIDNSLQFNKIALKYKLNDFALWINGIEVLTDNSLNAPIGLNTLRFEDGNGSNDFYGKTKQLKYFDTALTDAELKALTS